MTHAGHGELRRVIAPLLADPTLGQKPAGVARRTFGRDVYGYADPHYAVVTVDGRWFAVQSGYDRFDVHEYDTEAAAVDAYITAVRLDIEPEMFSECDVD